jgi:hypothetical protein
VQLVRRLQLSGVQAFPTNLRSTRRLQMPGSLFRGLFTRGIRLTHPIWWGAVGFCSTGRTSEGEEVKRRRRRSRQEVQRLVTEFRTSGLRPSKSDPRATHGTLQQGLRYRVRLGRGESKGGNVNGVALWL